MPYITEDEFLTLVVAGWHFHLLAFGHALAGGTVDLIELPEWNAIHGRSVARDG